MPLHSSRVGRGLRLAALLGSASLAIAAANAAVNARPANTGELTGQWLATITAPNFGDFRVYLTMARRNDGRYEAYSRRGALRALISWRQYVAGRLLGKLPPHLSVVHLDSLTEPAAGDSARIRGVFRSPMLGNFRMYGSLRHDTLRTDLRADSTAPIVGSVHMVRATTTPTLRDYSRLARSLADTMDAYLFNPRLMRTPAWRGFFEVVAKRFAEARDDADVMVGFYSQLPRLRTSHINLTHDPRLASMSVDSALRRVIAPPESLVTLTFPAPGVAQLHIRRWQRVTAVVDQAFARIDSARAHTLLVDIRANYGGDQSGVTMAGHLLADSLVVGYLLGNRWYRDHDGPPTPEEARGLPRTTRDDLLHYFHELRDRGVVMPFMQPRQPRFTGRVYLLINGWSGSASEPVAYLLKRTGRATLVGEPTPGAILAAVPHPVGDGWVMTLPEGDYFTADGVRLEGRGVAPDVRVPWQDVLYVVADSLRARDPYAAALLASLGAATNVTRENQVARGKVAERWAREALRLGPDSVAPVASLATALITQQRWDAGFAAMDSLLTRHKQPIPVHYHIGRLAAVSGQRLDDGERSLRLYIAAAPVRGAPTRAIAYWRLGMILEKKGNIAGARAAYESGLALEPTNGNLILALRQLGAK